MKNPSWWNDKHEGAWDRIKSAMQRDWEQTKADLFSKSGRDLDQGADDTVKQALGKEPIPPAGVPNPSAQDKEWDNIAPSYRLGVGAREQYGTDYADWDPKLESRLSDDWKATDDKRPWDEVKSTVRRAWDSAKK